MLQGGCTDWKAFLCMSGQLSNTPSPSASCTGSSLPVRPQEQGAECSDSCCPFPQQLAPLVLSPSSTTLRGALTHASDLGWARKTCKEKEMGPSSSKASMLWHYHRRGEAFCTLLPFLHNGRGRLWKSRAWAAVRYLRVMTNIWKFVL